MASMSTVTLTFLGAVGTVTGSKYLLTIDGRRVLVDAGMFQGEKEWRTMNWSPFPVDPATITDVVITHAHADHTGYLPALVKQGFRGHIWATQGTIRLTEIVLRDSAHLQELATRDAIEGGYSKHAAPQPLYTTEDVEATLPLFRRVDFDADVDLGSGLVGRWTRTAHMLGAACIRLEVGGTSVLFSGDLGRHDHPILKSRAKPPSADFVLCESTYGDREHPEPAIAHEDMANAIKATISRGGTVVIPAFAIDRTETVLRALTTMYREGRIPDVPVYVDGPMSVSALDIYEDITLDELRDDISVADFKGLPHLREARTGQESKAINNNRGPKIIISSSGMAEGGRVLHHLMRYLPDPNSCVILTGYQAEGTRGRALEEGAREVKINGKYVKVRSKVVRDHEFSVHGDASDLMDWLRDLDEPHNVFIVHGEAPVARVFAERIRGELGWSAVVPQYGEVVSLSPDMVDDDAPEIDPNVIQPAPAPTTGEPTRDGE